MAYTFINYPEFKDIKIFNVPGEDLLQVQQVLIDFITDPAHANYRWIESFVFYLNQKHRGGSPPLNNKWVAATIIYTE
jgi:hypothetical protein